MFNSPVAKLASGVVLSALVGLASSARAQEVHELTFEYNPSYYSPNQVSLTFDDGPGWQPATTLAVLDILKERDVKATFFINTGDAATSIDNEMTKQVIARIIEDGHELGTHTLNHGRLIQMSLDQVDTEINGVQDTIDALGVKYEISLFRAPFGEPYQWKWQQDQEWELDGEAQTGVARYAEIAPLAAQTMVHIGWNLDSDDWRCAAQAKPGESEGQCFSRTIIEKLSGTWDDPWSDETVKHYGNILMHSISPRTAEGLPAVLDFLEENKYEIVSTEYAVCRKYGSSSKNLVAGRTGGCDGVDPGDGDDGDGDDGDQGDGDDGDQGDGDDGDQGDGDDGDQGDGADGDQGDGADGSDDDDDDDESGKDGDDDDADGDEGKVVREVRCSVGSFASSAGLTPLALAFAAAIFVRRRRQRAAR